jgi:predicted nuclease of predicted toxin-antitoxin system
MTRGVTDTYTWLKASDLRQQVQKLLGLSVEQMGSAQWIGHLLKQLDLVHPGRRKHHVSGRMYALARAETLDMMRRYDVDTFDYGWVGESSDRIDRKSCKMKGEFLSTLKFYMDTHVDKQVAIQLRQRGITVVRCQDVGLADASNEEHLTYATQHDLSVITKDDDFATLHYEWMAQGKPHYGIFLHRDRQRATIGAIVTTCEEYYRLTAEGAGTLKDVYNQLIEIK